MKSTVTSPLSVSLLLFQNKSLKKLLHTYLISCSTSKNTKIETQEIHLSSGYASKNKIIHSLDPSSKTQPWLAYIKISKQIYIWFKNKKLVRYHVLFFYNSFP